MLFEVGDLVALKADLVFEVADSLVKGLDLVLGVGDRLEVFLALVLVEVELHVEFGTLPSHFPELLGVFLELNVLGLDVFMGELELSVSLLHGPDRLAKLVIQILHFLDIVVDHLLISSDFLSLQVAFVL